jgi:hypothetical protein
VWLAISLGVLAVVAGRRVAVRAARRMSKKIPVGHDGDESWP